MRPLDKRIFYTTCFALALGLPESILAQDGQADPPQTVGAAVAVHHEQATTSTAAQPEPEKDASSDLPDSPGASLSRAQPSPLQQDTSSQPAAPPAIRAEGPSTQTAQDQTQSREHPVGTAAAEAPRVKGVTAAEPAGVAIAPAKQRRVRTIVLKLGAIVGAGVALGTAIALTEATPSKPPGAH